MWTVTPGFSLFMLGDFEIVRILQASLERSRLSPANVTIEMTETARIADLRQASRNFKELAREVRQRPSRLLYSSPAPERKLP